MKKISMFIALWGMLSVSCTTDSIVPEKENQEHVQPSYDLVPMVINSGFTKTSLNGTTVNWTADDQVAVFDNLNSSNNFVAQSVEGSKAVFTGQVSSGTTDFYAVYPYEKALSASSTDIQINLPADQTSAAGTFAEEHNVSIAKGVKTVGVEQVSGVRFSNLCALIHFTIPQRLSKVSKVIFTAQNRPLAGVLTVSKSDMAVSSVSEGSNSLTMTGDFEAGSTFYFVAAPGEINGFSIEVQAQNGATYGKSSTKSFTAVAGKMKNLGVIDFTEQPQVKAEHVYDESDILVGTQVTLDLGLPDGMEQYVEKLVALMRSESGVLVRGIDTESVSSEETLGSKNGYIYIPQGAYTLAYTYTLNGVETSKAIEVTVPAPSFTVSAEATTSYTLYLDGKVNAEDVAEGEDYANNFAPDIVKNIKYNVSISNDVLTQMGLSYCSCSIKGLSGQSDLFDYNSQEDLGTVSSTSSVFYESAGITGVALGEYEISASATFDGVSEVAPPKTIYITGLPYIADTMVEDHWEYTYPAVCSNGVIVLGDSKGIGGGVVNMTRSFYIPESIPIRIKLNAALKTKYLMNSTFTVDVNGSTVISKKCSLDVTDDYEAISSFAPSSYSVRMESSYKVDGGITCNVNNFYIYYSK